MNQLWPSKWSSYSISGWGGPLSRLKSEVPSSTPKCNVTHLVVMTLWSDICGRASMVNYDLLPFSLTFSSTIVYKSPAFPPFITMLSFSFFQRLSSLLGLCWYLEKPVGIYASFQWIAGIGIGESGRLNRNLWYCFQNGFWYVFLVDHLLHQVLFPCPASSLNIFQ